MRSLDGDQWRWNRRGGVVLTLRRCPPAAALRRQPRQAPPPPRASILTASGDPPEASRGCARVGAPLPVLDLGAVAAMLGGSEASPRSSSCGGGSERSGGQPGEPLRVGERARGSGGLLSDGDRRLVARRRLAAAALRRRRARQQAAEEEDEPREFSRNFLGAFPRRQFARGVRAGAH